MISAERIAVGVAAVVAVLLQILLAPHIAIGYGIPNFLIVVCLVAAVSRPEQFGCVLPFILGLVYDLVSGGPLGAMAFSLTAFSVLTAWFFERVNNDTLFMSLLTLVLGLLLVEVSYGIFMLLFGSSIGFIDAFVYRILPGYLYDLILSLILYPIARRLFVGSVPLQSEIRQLH